jgi:hypothetical protein
MTEVLAVITEINRNNISLTVPLAGQSGELRLRERVVVFRESHFLDHHRNLE